MKYIVKDWAGNVMNWKGNPYNSYWRADEAISLHIDDYLGSYSEYEPDTDEWEKEYNECREEYYIDEVD